MDLIEFRETLDRIRAESKTEDDYYENVKTYVTIFRHQLPLFPQGNFVEEDYFRKSYTYGGIEYYKIGEHFSDFHIEEQFVEPELCIGKTWLYCNDRSEGRPKPDRLAKSLVYPVETAPHILVNKMGDRYLCNDGNHRIYAAYLRGTKVKIGILGSHKRIEEVSP